MAAAKEPTWSYLGARWWRFDFHTHTPASKDTGAWQAVLGTANELTPECWLLKYMAVEIDCVAVTDHNSGEWINKLKSVYANIRSEPSKPTWPGWHVLFTTTTCTTRLGWRARP